MDVYSILLPAIAAIFLLAWAYVAWLKFREHHHILRDDHLQRHKTHVTFVGRIFPRSRRE